MMVIVVIGRNKMIRADEICVGGEGSIIIINIIKNYIEVGDYLSNKTGR